MLGEYLNATHCTYRFGEASVVLLDDQVLLPDVVPEQDMDDSNMDSLDLLMMLGYIAENN